jgi:PIN domain nuclease of toxin-antitoxin system
MLNLDTHILIFALLGDLSLKEKRLLTQNKWSVSAIVLWEIFKLRQLKKIELDTDSLEFSTILANIHIWPIDLQVFRALNRLDFKNDPADEIIAATSLAFQIPLLTRDRKILKSKIVPFA